MRRWSHTYSNFFHKMVNLLSHCHLGRKKGVGLFGWLEAEWELGLKVFSIFSNTQKVVVWLTPCDGLDLRPILGEIGHCHNCDSLLAVREMVEGGRNPQFPGFFRHGPGLLKCLPRVCVLGGVNGQPATKFQSILRGACALGAPPWHHCGGGRRWIIKVEIVSPDR